MTEYNFWRIIHKQKTAYEIKRCDWSSDVCSSDLNDHRPREKQVIFGHTPSKTGAAYTVATGDICIDSACVYGRKLCALAINEDGNSKLFYADKSEEDDENL